MKKNIKFNEDARLAIKRGIDILAKAVRMTLGPRGRAVIIESEYGTPQVTFDGVTVAKAVQLPDPYENQGAELIKQAADKTNDRVGDGTTTATVLAHAMIDEGEKVLLDSNLGVIKLVEELNELGAKVILDLEEQRIEITDSQKIKEVATLSSKDATIGELVATVMQKIGKDGVVSLEDSNTTGSSFEIVEGMQLDRGYVSPFMMTNPARLEAVVEEPYILVTDKKVSSNQEILPLLEKLLKSGSKNLVVVADEVSGEALQTFVMNKLRGVVNVLAITAPGFGNNRREVLGDAAILTGATFISDEVGILLEDVKLEHLGRARRVVSNKDYSVIVGGEGKENQIADRVAQLKIQIERTESDFDKERFQQRLGKLLGGVAVIKVGAPTESAQQELKQRFEDSIAATKAAMEEGIVPGGGKALWNTGHLFEGMEITPALRIIRKAIFAPLTAIAENSGIDWESQTLDAGWVGLNALTGAIEDLQLAGIVDPLKVVKTAFQNALSVATNYLMAGAVMVNIKEEKND